jgi:hypothetical protein
MAQAVLMSKRAYVPHFKDEQLIRRRSTGRPPAATSVAACSRTRIHDWTS